MAVRQGARVIATAREHNHALLKELGASEVIDYSQEDFVEAIHGLHPGGVDVVLECADGDNLFKSLKSLRSGGRAGSIVAWDKSLPLRNDVNLTYIIGRPEGPRMTQVAQLVSKGELKVQIHKVFPLEEASSAMQLVESRHLQGKVVLRTSKPEKL